MTTWASTSSNQATARQVISLVSSSCRGIIPPSKLGFPKRRDKSRQKETKWDLSNRNGEYLGVGNFPHPVEGTKSAIKLGINDDLGQFYEKVR